MSGNPTNNDRAMWADVAVRAFSHQVGFTNGPELYDPPQDVLSDLLCDLLHWADANGLDFLAALKTAKMNYVEEVEEEAANDPAGW